MSELKKLGDFATIGSGYAFSSDAFSEDGIPIIRMSDLCNGFVDIKHAARVSQTKGLDGFKLNQGDFLIGMSGSLDAYGVVGTDVTIAYLNQRVGRLSIKDPKKAHYGFFAKVLSSDAYRKYVYREGIGAAQLNISSKQIECFEMYVPEYDIQEKIFQILDTIDTAIQQTQAIINKLKQLKQGLLHDLLTRGVDANGELRPCYDDAPHLYKESPLGWIPKDWEVCRVANLIVGIDAGKSPNCQDVPACGDQWGVLKVGAVHPDGLKLHENKVIEEEIFKKSNYLVRNGDLLFSRANTLDLVGFVCHVINSPKFLMLSDKTLRLTVKPSHMITRFLFWHFQHPEVRAQIEIGATGTSGSMKNISQSSIENILVCRPQINEQEKITQRLDNAVNNHKAEIENLLKMQSLKTALMDDLLTGRIRVTSLLQTEASSV